MLFCALNCVPCVLNSIEIIIITTLIYKRLRPLFYRLQEVGVSREDTTTWMLGARATQGVVAEESEATTYMMYSAGNNALTFSTMLADFCFWEYALLAILVLCVPPRGIESSLNSLECSTTVYSKFLCTYLVRTVNICTN